MSTRVLYCKIYDEAADVEPSKCRIVGYLRENTKKTVSEFFAGALKIFLLVEEYWEPFETVSPDISLENAKFLVVIPNRTSAALQSRPLPPPRPPVDLGGGKLKEASDRVVQIFTQAEGRPGTMVPLGTGALIKKNVIVTARHTVVDADGFFLDPLVDGRKVDFLIANPAADLALLRLSEPVENMKPFFVAASSKLEVGKSVAVLGHSLEADMSMDGKPMLQQARIVGIDQSGDRAFCPKFEGFSDACGAAVLYEWDLLAGIHVGTMNHPDAANRPLPIPPLALPEIFERNKEDVWAAPFMARDEAKARSIQESFKAKYPGEHAIITPAHHIYALMERARLIARDPLSRYPAHLARKATRTA
ncbi:hypothetical protein COCOBI_19-0220 [Coccomyxa sp. Obi]|nr:hypothetical protein COCOBI_19-0220 [Coccomyxa sp. Obi]